MYAVNCVAATAGSHTSMNRAVRVPYMRPCANEYAIPTAHSAFTRPAAGTGGLGALALMGMTQPARCRRAARQRAGTAMSST
jgi:hypothetical protein